MYKCYNHADYRFMKDLLDALTVGINIDSLKTSQAKVIVNNFWDTVLSGVPFANKKTIRAGELLLKKIGLEYLA